MQECTFGNTEAAKYLADSLNKINNRGLNAGVTRFLTKFNYLNSRIAKNLDSKAALPLLKINYKYHLIEIESRGYPELICSLVKNILKTYFKKKVREVKESG